MENEKGLATCRPRFNKASLLRMLTNAIYVGKIEHRGTIYSGEQTAIVDSKQWEEINTELRAAQHGKSKVIRTEQEALLKGLLVCRICDRPMMPTYTSKDGRRYRYYVCRAAKEKGSHTCPTKSIAAAALEQSVVTQLRSVLSVEGAREHLRISDADWLTFDEADPANLVRALVQRVEFDGANGNVSLELNRQ